MTGANGLVGSALCFLLEQGLHSVLRSVRSAAIPSEISVGDLNEKTDWHAILTKKVDWVVHLAAQTPLRDAAYDSYLGVNALATANLAQQCAKHGVKRFIFVSTVKVLGESGNAPFRDTDFAVPADAYALSKWRAEQMLGQVAAETGMEVVILRPPLVYGPGVKGNFLRLMQAIDKRRPLPLGCIQNRRSLIYLGNLIDAICVCLTHPKAAGNTFLVSDGDDVSTPELVRRIATALKRRPLLMPVPVSSMLWAGRLLGKEAAVDRLVGSLCVDISSLKEKLGWMPPYTMQAGLEATAQWYRKTNVTT